MNPLGLLNNLLWLAVAYGVSYLLLAFGLSLLGARMRQRSTWLAWIPVFNFYLMCRLARAPLLLILPALIPVLNFLVFAWLGAGMAKRVGRSGWFGALFGIPLLGNLVPLALGLHRPTDEEKAAPAPAQPPLVGAMIHAGVVFAILALPAACLLLAHHLTRDTAPAATVQQAAALLPKRVASTFTEFPIDSTPTHPAIATGLRTDTFDLPKPGDKPRAGLNADQLPPWMKPQSIPALAESATSASYTAPDTGAEVKVANLALRDDQAGDPTPPTAAELAAIAPEARATGVELKAAGDVTYRGYRVNTADSVYYALHRADSNSLVLISAKNNAAAVPLADRLAQNVGNGQGLMESATNRGALARLPPAPPGLKLVRMENATTAELDAMVARMNDRKLVAEFESQHSAGDQKLIELFFQLGKVIMPRSYSAAFYATSAEAEEAKSSSVAGFTSSSDAWAALQAIRTLVTTFHGLGLPINVTGTDVGDASGLAVEAGDAKGSFSCIILRRDASLVGFIAIGDKGTHYTAQDLRPWAESYVAKN